MLAYTTLPDPAVLTTLAQAGGAQRGSVLEIGVIVTALLGLLNLGYNLRHNRRASYVNTVTAARLKWIEELRRNLARFTALTFQYAFATPQAAADAEKVFQEIADLRTMLRLQLIPRGFEPDSLLADRVEKAFQMIVSQQTRHLQQELENLVLDGQDLLWKEWRKAKDEAIYGDPYDTFAHRLEVWSARLHQD